MTETMVAVKPMHFLPDYQYPFRTACGAGLLRRTRTGRVQAYADLRQVTCRRCLKAAQAITRCRVCGLDLRGEDTCPDGHRQELPRDAAIAQAVAPKLTALADEARALLAKVGRVGEVYDSARLSSAL